jgi:hypothetical protein
LKLLTELVRRLDVPVVLVILGVVQSEGAVRHVRIVGCKVLVLTAHDLISLAVTTVILIVGVLPPQQEAPVGFIRER